MAGQHNAVGGKIEPNETPLQTMSREVAEETNLTIPPDNWQPFGLMLSPSWHIHLFATIYQDDMSHAQTLTDEPVGWFPINQLPSTVASNLTWLVPLGIDYLDNDDLDSVVIEYDHPVGEYTAEMG